MEMLNSLLLKRDLWTILIDVFGNWLSNYGWAIIVFTICLKLLLVPLDIYQRVSTQKQSRFMSIMKPEMDALQVKYANDRAKLNEETNKLYKKYHMSIGGMCLPMLLTMGITLVVFFTLFGSLREYGSTKLTESYGALRSEYNTVLNDRDFATLTDDEKGEIATAVQTKYNSMKEKNHWLWVKNVWKSDTNTSQFVSFDDYAKSVGKDVINDDNKEIELGKYEYITSVIKGDEKDQNGYYVLIIVAVLVSFGTQFLSAKLLTPKGQKLNMMNKVMMAVIPLTMILFAMTSNVVFTLYIITNSLMTAIISTTISLIMKKKSGGKSDEQFIKEQRKVEVVEYSRNYKK